MSASIRRGFLDHAWPKCSTILETLIDAPKTNPFRAAEAIAIHKRVTDYRRSSLITPAPTPSEPAVHEALEDVLGARDINAKLFGYWARRVKGSRAGGFMLETQHNTTTKSNDITILKI
jgi:hypothetical protein